MCSSLDQLVGPSILILLLAVAASADSPNIDPLAIEIAKVTGQQSMKLPVRVVDQEGKPVANAKVIPWALRSSQGHGAWRSDDKAAHMGPKEVVTKDDGTATIIYPQYRYLDEQIRTIGVSLFVDHPRFAFVDSLHIDVPLESSEPYEIKLTPGVQLEVQPLIDGKPADLNGILARWSDGRSWRKDTAPPEHTAAGTLRFSAMPPGNNNIILIKLDGDRATHFSKITDFELKQGDSKPIEVALRPSLRVTGKLSDNVPRPVKNGRVKLMTLPPPKAGSNRPEWFSWAPIESDGTFVIDSWPDGEPMQLVALCAGYIATSGAAPENVEHKYEPGKDPYYRPQVFDISRDPQIEVTMTPLVTCVATTLDEDEKPIAGVKIGACPNVGWWNSGSQIYCDPLVRGERLLQDRDYELAVDKAFPAPFQAVTDADGQAKLELPVGKEDLSVSSDVYELPVFLGSRRVRIQLTGGEPATATLRLQPRGTEKLGEWDKLAGVVFGCSTREGRRICALPEVSKKMEEFATRFRQAKDQRDPQLLSEAYTAVADAFVGVGDKEEADKWRQKAAEQAAKVGDAATPNKD